MNRTLRLAEQFLRLLGRFGRSKSGNIAVIFAITLIPMLAATGMVVDYTRAAKARQQLQDALDSTALFLSKNSSVSTMTSAQLLAQAQTYFNVNFTNTDVSNTTISPSYTSTGPSVTVSGTTDSPCAFMSILGIQYIPVSGTSTAVWGHERLRVALVLDNTGSMSSSNKLTALKTATTNLLTQLKSAVTVAGDVYVSIIPFVKDVNVGSSNYAQTWVAWDDSTNCGTAAQKALTTCDGWWDGSNGTCSITSGTHSPRSYCLALGTCNITSKTSSSSCTSSSGCFVSGTYSSTYTSSSTCTAVGTCSLSSYTTQSTCTAAGTCSISSRTTQSACTATGTCSISGYTTQSTCTAAGTCSRSQYTTQSTCTNNHSTWTAGVWTSQTAGTWTTGTWTTTGVWSAGTWTSATWTPTTHSASNWNGCVTDRGTSPFSVSTGVDTGPGTGSANDQLTTTPTTSDVSTLFPAQQYSSCPQAVIGLSYDWTALNTEVTNMVANGSTNQPIGLVHGWQSLVGGGPYTVPAMDSSYQYKQVIILLSDGLNTQDRWYGNGSATSTSVDYRMYYSSGSTISGTCKNIKDQGIIIYTVQVNTDNSATSTLLQNCATDTSKFFLLTSSDQIITTFAAIGTALSDLRLSN